MELKGVASWLSDHPPTEEQREYLTSRDYLIQWTPSPKNGRWQNAEHAYNVMLSQGKPDVIVLVLPSWMGGRFIELAGNIPVYQAVMRQNCGEWEWLGSWERLTGTSFVRHTEEIPVAKKKRGNNTRYG